MILANYVYSLLRAALAIAFIDQTPGVVADDFEHVPTTTVVDILSSQVQFSKFLRVIQRNGLVPLLNQMDNFTLVAPINSAFLPSDLNAFDSEELKRYLIPYVIYSDSFEGVRIFPNLVNNPTSFTSFDEYGEFKVSNISIVEPDLEAESQDAVVQGVEELLSPVDDLYATLSEKGDFGEILRASTIDSDFLNNVTCFLPRKLPYNEVEFSYLTSQYANEDQKTFLFHHLVPGIYGGDVNTSLVNLNGDIVDFSSVDHGLEISLNDTFLSTEANVLASNGIIHEFSTNLFKGFPHFTPLKVLYGLNESEFVDEIIFRKLSYLIDDPSLNQTIFIPRVTDNDDDTENFQPYGVNKNNILYQFAEGQLSGNSELLDSKYCPSKIGGCQKLKLNLIGHDLFINNLVVVDSSSYKIGNTSIFYIDEALTTPSSLGTAVGSYFHCSRSLQFLEDLDLLHFPKSKGYTVLLPCFNSWNNLGLTLDYLRSNKTALALVLENLIIDGPIYSDFVGTVESTSIANEPVILTIEPDDDQDGITKLKVNDTELDLRKYTDILFDVGVVHPVSEIILPESLDIKLQQLLTVVDSTIFQDILSWSNLTEILEEDGYSILLPTKESLESSNITLFSNPSYLKSFIALHILPPGSLDKLIDCENRIPTLLNNTNLSCRRVSKDSVTLQIVEGKDKEVRVINKGCTKRTLHHESVHPGRYNKSSCLLILDRPIDPNWLFDDPNKVPMIHLPMVAVSIGVLIGILFISAILSCCVLCIFRTDKNTDEEQPLIEETLEENEERRRLEAHHHNYHSTEHGNIEDNTNSSGAEGQKTSPSTEFSEGNYSEHSKSKPIPV
ncbi:hypothetical protein PP7435_CHR2-0886 [Komagataella phaffii CBS 7435]|uniref:FAS1 domain-containing protein n=2 Tax=Komagataella phaffii TaxID=460519 RepID=C4R0L0_KOMPG|nr:uncharacterized protein PAS_chr2-1_0413 [Komagataella phaffii GS115]AOA62491.1 GQ67_00454T0 [Komagataella phaffii]CAH2448447.1 hypothetical protein BQ9382_C2-4775 [Komagataella phaffii CBS 7435]AOA67499.1 GQ68_00935T0 [Komagataella phaffii GS115]CAY69034.1 Putative protein of unknown function [Komagataella phaffii GS115]CCA38568.1 hypothetical protein PP7435_CHR2-0886 [Komagataella phaffii CBS 7435]